MEKKTNKRKDKIEFYGKSLEALEGQILGGKYLVGTYVDKGSQGSIYNVIDTTQPNNQSAYVMKIGLDISNITHEV